MQKVLGNKADRVSDRAWRESPHGGLFFCFYGCFYDKVPWKGIIILVYKINIDNYTIRMYNNANKGGRKDGGYVFVL